MERDVISVLVDLLDELKRQRASNDNLASSIDALTKRLSVEPKKAEPKPKPETWLDRARAYVASTEARNLSEKNALTIDVVAAVSGLENPTNGHRKMMGRILMDAGYRRVSAGHKKHDYRQI